RLGQVRRVQVPLGPTASGSQIDPAFHPEAARLIIQGCKELIDQVSDRPVGAVANVGGGGAGGTPRLLDRATLAGAARKVLDTAGYLDAYVRYWAVTFAKDQSPQTPQKGWGGFRDALATLDVEDTDVSLKKAAEARKGALSQVTLDEGQVVASDAKQRAVK